MVNNRSLSVSSDAFAFGARIPERYSMVGEDVSPPLAWTGMPPETEEIAIICDDPDAPLLAPFVHWVVYGIPSSVDHLTEGHHSVGRVGKNDFRNQGYNGPKPPVGHGPHNYYFWVFALGTSLDAPEGLTGQELRELMRGHVLQQNRLVGTFERVR